MGLPSCERPSVVSFALSEGGQGQLPNQVSSSSQCYQITLTWWRSPAISKGRLFHEPQCLVLTTDASLSRWGAHIQSQVAQGTWSSHNQRRNINWLELRAVYLALLCFWQLVTNKHLLVLMDNVATKVHINCQGSTRSSGLMLEAKRLGLWAEQHLCSLTAEHISGVAYVQATGSAGQPLTTQSGACTRTSSGTCWTTMAFRRWISLTPQRTCSSPVFMPGFQLPGQRG